MSNQTEVKSYFARIEQAYRRGNATEHTYRPDLKMLIERLVPSVIATNEPKRSQAGAPDFVITSGTGPMQRTLGHIEAKDIGVPLDREDASEQLSRYKRALHNLILTDYVEFRWYVDGVLRMTARSGLVGVGKKLTWDAACAVHVAELLQAFLGLRPPQITGPRDLAERMAQLAHIIRDRTVETMEAGETSDTLRDLYAAFKEVLIPDLSVGQFGDMFAQTLVYGLFAARYNHTGTMPFRREDGATEIPKTNPFLRRLFGTIAGSEISGEPFMFFVDELARLLAETDMAAVLADFGKPTRQDDPIVHFYETFLQAYDPKLRELRGVYYTPEPVVSYIVRSVDALIKSEFGLRGGLADISTTSYERRHEEGKPENVSSPRVLILDPACGTGTFLYHVVNHIRTGYQFGGGGAGMWSGYVSKHLLPRLFGFELLMAPYAMAHLKLGMQLAGLDLPEAQREDWGYDFQGSERLGVYLTNTLEEAEKRAGRLALGAYISDEANAAANVKQDYPVMVVLGNPPYSGHSANKSKWITALLRGKDPLSGNQTGNYFEVDGRPLGECNPKWLNDDYVKFIRFAQWRIERTGHGILAFVTNHGYLDNPTFRGMRQSLMQTFDEIYVLDLHGNSKKRERSPDGSKDENVFDIQQGVAIGIFVRRQGTPGTKRSAIVHHAHLWGERARKYDWLSERDAIDTAWTRLDPQAPFYFFKPRDRDLQAEYALGWAVPKAMSENSLGILRKRDPLVVGFTQHELLQNVAMFMDRNRSDGESAEHFGLPLRDNDNWDIAKARKAVGNRAEARFVEALTYRPLDCRHVYYHDALVARMNARVMRHLRERNVALVLGRLGAATGAETWDVAFVTSTLIDQNIYRRGGGTVFPLYLYPDPARPILLQADPYMEAGDGRRPNLAPALISDFARRLRLAWIPDGKGDRINTFGPEDVFAYVYAILHAPSYRERYNEFLKEDFPQLPHISDAILFRDLCGLGDRLVRLHLMEQEAASIATYPVRGNDLVEQVRYTAPGAGRGSRARLDQQDAVFRGRTAGGLGVPYRRLPGLREVAKRPQGARTELRRPGALSAGGGGAGGDTGGHGSD